MQTFLPIANYEQTAKCLDNKRLGKQRVETWQILRALRKETKGWQNHPATIMWQGYEQALIHYGIAICTEWRARGFQDSMLALFIAHADGDHYELPWWFGWQPLHLSHQSNLLRKDFDYYSQHFATRDASLPYIWCKPDKTFTGVTPEIANALLPAW